MNFTSRALILSAYPYDFEDDLGKRVTGVSLYVLSEKTNGYGIEKLTAPFTLSCFFEGLKYPAICDLPVSSSTSTSGRTSLRLIESQFDSSPPAFQGKLAWIEYLHLADCILQPQPQSQSHSRTSRPPSDAKVPAAMAK